MFMVGPEGQQVPLCLDCYIRYQNVMWQQQKMAERQINYSTAAMESMAGLPPGILPRYPDPGAVIQTGDVTLNNIHISNSDIGVLNTGTIESIDATLTVLKTEGNAGLAAAVTALSEAVIKSQKITVEQKNQIMELLDALSEQAVAPREKRKTSVVRAVFGELSGVLSGIATVAGLWQKASSVFQKVFGI